MKIYLAKALETYQLSDSRMNKWEDSGGIGWGDHFVPYRFIERIFEC